MVTGNNKRSFEKWLFYSFYSQDQNTFIKFANLKFEEKTGVFLKYYDSIGEYVNAISYEKQGYWRALANHILPKRYKTRVEALTEALKQADKMMNKNNP